MRLNDPLITCFVYKDQEYQIDLSFDVVLDCFDVMKDKTLRDGEKAEICLELLLNESIKGKEAIELWNYIYKEFIDIEFKQPIEYDLKGNPMPSRKEKSEKIIDIHKDAEYIYASFQQAYGMNLFKEQGKLHWHEFHALLNGLPPDTVMQRIIQIRLWKPRKGDSAEYKETMRKLKRMYAVNDDDSEEVEE